MYVMTLGEALRHCRIAANRTQQEVADDLGFDRVTIARWECDTHAPRAPDLPRVAKAYRTTAAGIMWLVEREAA